MQTRWNSYALAAQRYIAIHDDLSRYASSTQAEQVGAVVIQGNLLLPEELANLKAI